MKIRILAVRTGKEILRDPLNIAFGIGFPVVLLLLLSAIQANVPVSLFEINQLAPGIAVFGLSFISLFSGVLIAKDRSSSFMMRMLSAPVSAPAFIIGYILPLVPVALAQSIVCFAVALLLGAKLSVYMLLALLVLLPTAVLYISIGLLAGSLLNDKQVGGVCGALLTNVSAWLSGIWFDLSLIGGAFETAAKLLPFAHAVKAAQAAFSGELSSVFPSLWWVIGYAGAFMLLAVWVFSRRTLAKE